MSDNLTNFGKGYLFGSIIFSRPVRFLFRWICWLIAVPAGVQSVLNGEYKVGLIVLAIVGVWMWRRWQWRLAGDYDYDE